MWKGLRGVSRTLSIICDGPVFGNSFVTDVRQSPKYAAGAYFSINFEKIDMFHPL